MEQYLFPILGALAYGLVTFGIGYLIGKLGISKIETDIKTIKDDISSFHLHSPITYTPTIIHPTPSTSPILTSTTGQAVNPASVVAHF